MILRLNEWQGEVRSLLKDDGTMTDSEITAYLDDDYYTDGYSPEDTALEILNEYDDDTHSRQAR